VAIVVAIRVDECLLSYDPPGTRIDDQASIERVFKNGVRPNSRSFVAAKTGPLLRMTPFLKHALANLAGKLPSYRVFMVLNPLKGTPVRANGDVELE
jgi:hypothetical protein